MSSIIRNFLVFNIIFILSTAELLAKDLKKIVAAKVNNHIISAQDVLNAVNTLPENIKTKPLSEIYPRIINELINKHLITKRAYNEKLDLDQNVLNLIQKNKDSILAKYWLNNYIKNETSEENIKNFYNEYVKSFKGYTEVNASHILVKTKNEAVSIINKLKSKSQFSELAKTFSIGPSGKNGGNLGWFGPGQMVKEFEKAALLIEKGNKYKKYVCATFSSLSPFYLVTSHIRTITDINEMTSCIKVTARSNQQHNTAYQLLSAILHLHHVWYNVIM